MKFRTPLLPAAAALALALAAFGASAVPVTYAFTAEGNHAGSFTFDDAASATSSNPLGATYGASSFVIDGKSYQGPVLALNTGFPYAQSATFKSSTLTPFVQLTNLGDSLFKSSLANQMDGKTLASFGFEDGDFLFLNARNYELTSLHQVTAVPEPGTYMLMLAGLLGIGMLVRQRRS